MVGNVATGGTGLPRDGLLQGQLAGTGASLVPPVHLGWHDFRRGSPPQGLRNLGNTCYLNSVLQCLTYTSPLANYCILNSHTSLCESLNSSNSASCPFCFLERRISRSLTFEAAVDAPVKISNRLRMFAAHFRNGRQEDAHEFLRYVIEACNNSCIQLLQAATGGKGSRKQREVGVAKEEPHTVVKEIFGGALQSQVKCLSCQGESNKRDEMMDLSLDVGRLSSLKEALCSFFQPEVLDADNKYRCGNCKKLSTAGKQMSIFRAPNVLVIQFKRFENFFGGKIDRHIQFEERLGLAVHMCKASKDARPEYSLYGVIVHAGHTQDSGHYYAYVKDSGGRWYCCDDSSVTSVSIQSVLADRAYILFYIRTNAGMKKVSTVGASCGALLSTQVNGLDAARAQKQIQQESSISPVKASVCAGGTDEIPVSSVSKTRLHFFGPSRGNADRLIVKVDAYQGREFSEKAQSIIQGNQLSKDSFSASGVVNHGDSESALIGYSSLEGDGQDSALTSTTAHLSSRKSANGKAVSVSEPCAPLVDVATAVTSPSVNTSSSSSNHFLAATDPASRCTGSSNRDHKNGVDCNAKLLHDIGSETEANRKRSRFDNGSQPRGADSGTSGSPSTLTDLGKEIEEVGGHLAGLDRLKCRLQHEGRKKLLQSDWCDSLRNLLRAAKKRRLAGQGCLSDEEKPRIRVAPDTGSVKFSMVAG